MSRNPTFGAAALALLFVGCSPVDTDSVIVLADFEGPDWAPWQASGNAFVDDKGNPRKARAGGWEGRLGNVLGTGLVDTFVSDPTENLTLQDAATGSIVSPDFPLNRRWLNVGIDGGSQSPLAPESAALSVFVDDALVHFVTGDAAFPLALMASSIDLAEHRGGTLRIEVDDRSAGGFGWVAVDGITLSAVPSARTERVIGTFDDAESLIATGWTAEGAFASPVGASAWAGVTEGGPAIGARGVSTCEIGGADCATPRGVLVSPAFDVDARYLNVLVAGGNGGNEVALELVDDDGSVAMAYPPSDCGLALSEATWRHFDLEDHQGDSLQLQIVDASEAICGHILVDHAYLSEQPRGLPAAIEQRDPEDAINVDVPDDAFDDVIGTFDNPVDTIEIEGWTPSGDFADPAGTLAWVGTTDDPLAARVGGAAVSTCELAGLSCDGPTGDLLSPPIVVRADFISFLMSGGDGATVGLEVLDEVGGVLARYSPNACAPSFVDGNDDWHHIDVSGFRGETVRVRIFDESSGNCGFVSFDHVYQSDRGNGDLVDVAEEPVEDPEAVNVTVADDAFDQVVVDFDDPQAIALAGFALQGAFANPTSPTSWVGTSNNASAARVGDHAVSTCEIGGGNCDQPTGSITTPEFSASADYLVFLMSGGDGVADVGLQVLDSDSVALGAYVPSSCSPSFIDGDDDWVSIDISSRAGEGLRVRLYDDATGSCGFVSADHVYLSDTPRGTVVPLE